jgi:hypothetical protein
MQQKDIRYRVASQLARVHTLKNAFFWLGLRQKLPTSLACKPLKTMRAHRIRGTVRYAVRYAGVHSLGTNPEGSCPRLAQPAK